jgi:hypothetical protein
MKAPMELEEIDKKIAELQALRDDALKAAEEKRARENFEEITELVPRLVEILHKLHTLGYSAPKLTTALTDDRGKYNPGLFIKRPRSPAMLHSE